MQIKFDGNLKNLEGGDIPDSDMGKLLANQLASGTEGDCIKFIDWSIKIFNGEAIEIDSSDYDKLYKEIEGMKTLTRLAKAQLLKSMKAQKELSEKAEEEKKKKESENKA